MKESRSISSFKSLDSMIEACEKDLRDYVDSALDTQRELDYIREMNSGELYPCWFYCFFIKINN